MIDFNRRRVIAVAGVVSAVAVIALAGCSSVTPSVGQYAITTSHGSFSNQQVDDVVAPGGHVKLNGVTAWYLPAQFRNYVTAPKSRDVNIVPDRTDPLTVITGAGTDGEPGMPVKVNTYVGWELNPAIIRKMTDGKIDLKFARDFLPFCMKYGCASHKAQNSNANQNQIRSSDPGWLTMQDELFPTAIDSATQTAIRGFGPDLWTTQKDYVSLGSAIARQLLTEWAKVDDSPAGEPYFCGPSSTPQRCDPPLVLIKSVIPTDPGVVSAYNQKITAFYNQQAAAARYSAAFPLYGKDTNWALAVQDMEGKCPHTCNIYVGNPPLHP